MLTSGANFGGRGCGSTSNREKSAAFSDHTCGNTAGRGKAVSLRLVLQGGKRSRCYAGLHAWETQSDALATPGIIEVFTHYPKNMVYAR